MRRIKRRFTNGPGPWLVLAVAALLMPARADAQWVSVPGLGGWQFGTAFPDPVLYSGLPNVVNAPLNGFVGPGGYGVWAGGLANPYGFGTSPYTSAANNAFNNYLRGSVAASRYNMNNAEAALAYQAANLFHQEALGTMMDNYLGDKYATAPRYSIRSAAPVAAPYSLGNVPYGRQRERHPGVAVGGVEHRTGPAGGGVGTSPPFSHLIGDDGEVLWPLGAPDKDDLGTKKQAADRAIRDVLQDARQGRWVPTRRVVDAREKLAAYVNPAADAVRKHNEDDLDGFVDFVQTLDAGLRSLAEGGQTPRARGTDLDPPNTPRTGGDVLEKTLKKGDRTAPRDRE